MPATSKIIDNFFYCTCCHFCENFALYLFAYVDCKVKTNDSFLFRCSRLIITEEISICLDLNKTLLSSIYSPVPGSDCWDRGLPWPIVNKLSVSLDPSHMKQAQINPNLNGAYFPHNSSNAWSRVVIES